MIDALGRRTIMSISTARPRVAVSDEQLAELRVWNLALTVLHLVQAIAILLLAADRTLTVTSSFSAGSGAVGVAKSQALLEVPVSAAVAGFLALAAFSHLMSGVVVRNRYEHDLRRGINRLRWVEYAVSATWMLLLIALFVGITDVVALIAIAAANVGAILYGWLQELMNPPRREQTLMTPFVFGVITALIVWLAIVLSMVASSGLPDFVVGVVLVQGLVFVCFPINQWLQYRRVGMWRDYAYGEKTYALLSLVAKSLMAWQIFGGFLAA